MSTLLGNDAPSDAARKQAWLAERRKYVTSTDVPVLFGVGYSGSSIARLFADKKGQAPQFEANERMTMGRLMQPVISALYQEKTGLQVINADPYTLFKSEEYLWLATSLDAFDSEGRELEIKNTSDYVPEDDLGAVPTCWLMQCQTQMVVMKKPVRLVILSQGTYLRIFDMKPNADFVAAMLAKTKAFHDAVQSGSCPPPEHGADSEGLKYVFNEPRDGEMVALDDSFVELVDERKELDQALAEAKERRDRIDGQLKFALGNATVGVLSDGRHVTWKPNKNGVRSLRVD